MNIMESVMVINNGKKIDIDLNNGIYIFDKVSGSGKTYLFNILSKITSTTDFLCITYTNHSFIEDLKSLCNRRNTKLLFLDRYDLYCDKFKEDIMSLSKDITVILDLKNIPNDIYINSSSCYIELTKDCIKVGAYDNI